MAVPSQDVTELIEELRERIGEELDYLREADNQRQFAAYFDGHPTITVPKIVDELSTARVITSELADRGAVRARCSTGPQEEKDLAAETIYRFTFRCLYELHAFNGDPHPGNYLFEPGGQVTFLDFGLVKHFTAERARPARQHDRDAVRARRPRGVPPRDGGRRLPRAGRADRDRSGRRRTCRCSTTRSASAGPRTMTSEYASAVARRYVDFKSPLAAYAKIPRSYVIVQRINLGLFAILGEMNATADWRAISEEIWPLPGAPPSTPMGEAETALARRGARPIGCPPRWTDQSAERMPAAPVRHCLSSRCGGSGRRPR